MRKNITVKFSYKQIKGKWLNVCAQIITSSSAFPSDYIIQMVTVTLTSRIMF